MKIKFKRFRNFSFYKTRTYTTENSYKTVRDSELVSKACELGKKYNVQIISFNSDYISKRIITTRATREDFLNFIHDYCNIFFQYIEDITY